jgi:hypothetical protein
MKINNNAQVVEWTWIGIQRFPEVDMISPKKRKCISGFIV